MSNLFSFGRIVSASIEKNISKIVQGLEQLIGGPEAGLALDVLGGTGKSVVTKPQSAQDMFSPSILLANDCKKLDTGGAIVSKRKTGPVCKTPDMRPKIIPPYIYGYCKEREPELPMSCPPKIKKRGRGPCCHDEHAKQTKGGCRTNK